MQNGWTGLSKLTVPAGLSSTPIEEAYSLLSPNSSDLKIASHRKWDWTTICGHEAKDIEDHNSCHATFQQC